MNKDQRRLVQSDPFNPPAETQVITGTDEQILSILRELKISYPNELAAWTGFSQQTVLARLAFMRVHGQVEKVEIGHSPPDDLAARLPQFWKQGLKGAQLRRCAWHRIVDHGAEEKK